VRVYGIFDNMTFKDETGEVQVLHIRSAGDAEPRPENPHADGMLIGYVVGPKLVYVTDMISPRGAAIERSENTTAVGYALREFDVEGDLTIVGGHGTTVKRSEIEAALAE
jgi:hypothetical protein